MKEACGIVDCGQRGVLLLQWVTREMHWPAAFLIAERDLSISVPHNFCCVASIEVECTCTPEAELQFGMLSLLVCS